MNKSRWHFRLLIIPFLICLFIFYDAQLAPQTVREEFIRLLDEKRPSTAGRSYRFHYIETSEGYFSVPEELYGHVSVGDTLLITRSSLTDIRQGAILNRNGNGYYYGLGLVHSGNGSFLLPALFIATILVRILYRRISNLQGRAAVTYAVLALSVFLLLIYLGF
jgi:hypothetical protein